MYLRTVIKHKRGKKNGAYRDHGYLWTFSCCAVRDPRCRGVSLGTASGAFVDPRTHNTAIGIIYAALYVMFGVMVGFSAYLMLNKYTTSQNTVKSEANNVKELYWLAEHFPEPERGQIQALATSYARVVVDEEWPTMKLGQTSPNAQADASALWQSIEDLEPDADAEQAICFKLWSVSTIWMNPERFVCLTSAKAYLPFCEHSGEFVYRHDTFTYLVGMKSPRLHALPVAALTGGIAFIIFTIVVLDHTFGGDFRLGPDAFELVLGTMEQGSGKW